MYPGHEITLNHTQKMDTCVICDVLSHFTQETIYLNEN